MCNVLFRLLLVTLVAAAFFPCVVTADDAAEQNERRFAELQEQMQQMRAELEELRALLRDVRTEHEAAKPDLPPELQERLHTMKNEIQELMQAGRVDEPMPSNVRPRLCWNASQPRTRRNLRRTPLK